MSALALVSPAAACNQAIARSPMERLAKAAGARFEVRAGWNVAVAYDRPPSKDAVAWADASHLSKWEVRGGRAGTEFTTARREGEAWWCGVTRDRGLVLGGSEAPEDALDVTCNYAALTISGPQARETIARFCAIDLRPDQAPPNSFRPGSIARQPGMVLVEATDRFLILFGWALGEYMWRVVEDAATHLGGAPIGLDDLEQHA